MNSIQLESFFFRPAPKSADQLSELRGESSKEFRPPPIRLERKPYRLDLAAVLPQRNEAIRQAGKICFHTVGDTGGVNGLGAQQNVADHMTRQIHDSSLPDQASFFYHLGDVVYYTGDDLGYHDQFYHPYQDYPAPIFAIPGNHDGETRDPAETVKPFMKHFCAAEAARAPEAGHSYRPTMIQPNCYWTLETPVVTIVGVYSNVSGELDDADGEVRTQRDWLTEELSAAPAGKCLLVAVHHPVYSLGKHGGTKAIEQDLEHAMKASDRMPDAVITGHDHCYQRFTRKRDGWRIPFLVVGAGGFAGYDDMTKVKSSLAPPEDVKLEEYEDKRPGFLRVTVTHDELTGEYFTVPKPGNESKPAKLRDKFSIDLRTHRLV
jgi:predicted phosphodiesterase